MHAVLAALPRIPTPQFLRDLSPAARLAIGLVALMTCLILLIDYAVGIVPDRSDAARRIRQSTAELVAVQAAALLPSNDVATIRRLLDEVRERGHGDLKSVALRTRDGAIVVQSGDHDRHWISPPGEVSTLEFLRVPIHAGAVPWGTVELAFESVYPDSVFGWMAEPMVQGVAGLLLSASLGYYFYLRRALHYLDPASAVPERVRNAFDTLSEGVLITDPAGRIVLANQAFRKLVPDGKTVLHGRNASHVGWLVASVGTPIDELPWNRALSERRTTQIGSISLVGPGGTPTGQRVSLKATPITDGDGEAKGCLITFDDVSLLFDTNQALRSALDDLKASRAEIERQNSELERLASRDPLTGCLNRRSFFAKLDEARAALPAGAPLALVMCDIDHFKSFNDRFGHAVGDEVLVGVARLLQAGVRTEDLICRMGGEEFCVAMPGLTAERAADRADLLRRAMERDAGRAMSMVRGLQVTASFGVAAATDEVGVAHILELADQALYQAKKSGRNRVVRWPFAASDAPVEAIPAKAPVHS